MEQKLETPLIVNPKTSIGKPKKTYKEGGLAKNGVGTIGNKISRAFIKPLNDELQKKDLAYDLYKNIVFKSLPYMDKTSLRLSLDTITGIFIDNTEKKQKASDTLIAIDSSHAFKSLLNQLSEEDYESRIIAVKALGKVGEDSVQTLIDKLHDKDFRVRGGVVEALGYIGSERAVEALIISLNEDDPVRAKAAEALGRIGSIRAVNSLIAHVEDLDYRFRWKVIEALGHIGSVDAAQALMNKLDDYEESIYDSAVLSTSYGVDSITAWALSCIGVDNRSVIEGLIARLEDHNPLVRDRAVQALGLIDSIEVMNIIALSLKDSDASVRKSAAQALSKSNFDGYEKPLIMAINDNDSEVRQEVVRALGRIGSKRSALSKCPPLVLK